MKWKIEKKYITVGFIALIVIVLGISFNFILEHETRFEEFKMIFTGTMWPILIGSIMAYLLNPILKFFERCFFTPLAKFIFRGKNRETKQKKFSRGFGILLTILFFLVILFGGLYLVVPQVYLSLSRIVSEAPKYYNEITAWVNSLGKQNSEVSKYLLLGIERVYSQAIMYLNEDILPNMDKIVAEITSGIVVGLKAILNCILAIIISVYVMLEKERLICVAKKFTCSMFSREHANSILKGVRYVDKVFGGFINGKIIDSFIIGAICYAFMNIFNFEYSVLISIIVGLTNIIPYFGPFIGAIPSVLILLMIDFKQGLIFTIFIIVLQQIDGNIIGPIILGDRLKMSSMWILFAILIGGGFFGVPGMILGAPCFACIYALISTICRSKLTKKKLPINTEDYFDIDYLTVDSDIELKLKQSKEKKEIKEESNQAQTEKEGRDNIDN